MIPIIRMTNFFPALRPAIDDTRGYNLEQGNLEYLRGSCPFLFLRLASRTQNSIELYPREPESRDCFSASQSVFSDTHITAQGKCTTPGPHSWWWWWWLWWRPHRQSGMDCKREKSYSERLVVWWLLSSSTLGTGPDTSKFCNITTSGLIPLNVHEIGAAWG